MKPRQELHLFFASENTTALILYRASNSLYRLIGWDINGDHFTPGQWLKSRVFETNCALSPDGKYFLYAAMQHGASDLFMAVSHPPYFTAVEYIPGLTSFSTGGFFIDASTLSLKCTQSRPEIYTLACGLEINADRAHWSHLRTDAEWKRTPKGERARWVQTDKERRGQSPALVDCYHCSGPRLYRKNASGKALLADFSEMAFEPIVAPYEGVARMVSQ